MAKLETIENGSKRVITAESQTIAKIARDCFNCKTLETQNSDSLDFFNVAVWQIKEALQRAYAAGYADSIKG